MIRKIPILGVDVGEHSAKYVLVSSVGKELVVAQWGIVELKDKGEGVREALQKIRAALAATGVKAFRTVVGVSGQSVFLRFVRLPPVAKRQMDQIVRYEAQQQVPFPIEEVRWDYQVLSSVSDEECDVVLVAVKNEIVEQLTDFFVQAELVPALVDASVLALYNCLAFNQTIHPGTSSLILDIGARTTHILVADRGGLWIRNIPIAGNHLTQAIADIMRVSFQEAEKIKMELGAKPDEFGQEPQLKQQVYGAIEKALGRLFAEVSRSLGFYRSQYPNAMINDIYLCGGGSLLKGLDQAAKERFNLPVKRLDGTAGFKTAGTVPAADLGRGKVFFAGALGLALRLCGRCRLHIDLVPNNLRKQKDLVRRVTYVAATYVTLMIMGISLFAYSTKLAQVQLLRTGVLQTSYDDMKKLSVGVHGEKARLDDLRAKFQMVEGALVSAQMWPAVMGAIAEALPNNFWIVRISGEQMIPPSSGKPEPFWGSVLLEGKTSGDIDRDLPGFREAMIKNPLFADVEIVSAQVTGGVVDFVLKFHIKNGSLQRPLPKVPEVRP